MKRFLIAVVAALSLLAGTSVPSLAGPPHDTSPGDVCEFADEKQDKLFPCDNYG